MSHSSDTMQLFNKSFDHLSTQLSEWKRWRRRRALGRVYGWKVEGDVPAITRNTPEPDAVAPLVQCKHMPCGW